MLRALLTGLFIVLFLFPLLLKLSRAKTTEDRRTAARRGAGTGGSGGRHRDRGEAGRSACRDRDDAGRAGVGQCPHGDRGADRDRSGGAAPSRRRGDRGPDARLVGTGHRGRRRVGGRSVDGRIAEIGQPARVDRVSGGREALADPGAAGRGGAAVRWMRPFVPPIVASAIDTTTRPLRGARQVFEETEEIHFSLRRSHRVSVTSEETAEPAEQWIDATPATQIKKTKTTRIDRPKRQARTEVRSGGGRRQLPSADG